MGTRDVLVRPICQVGGGFKVYAVLCPTYTAQLSRFSGSRVGLGQPRHGGPGLNPTAITYSSTSLLEGLGITEFASVACAATLLFSIYAACTLLTVAVCSRQVSHL
jgi:hypothetical protein